MQISRARVFECTVKRWKVLPETERPKFTIQPENASPRDSSAIESQSYAQAWKVSREFQGVWYRLLEISVNFENRNLEIWSWTLEIQIAFEK
jgi:hypothetical protein